MSSQVSDAYRLILTQQLPEKRLNHVMRVAETCKGLSLRYGANSNDAYMAGLFHDLAKYQSPQALAEDFNLPEEKLETQLYNQFRPVWHAYVAPLFVRHFFPEDPVFSPDVCQAMVWHTTGTDEMSLLDKILYVGDYIEPGRIGEPVDLVRQYAEINLDHAVFALSTIVLYHLLQTNRAIHPESIACRNAALLRCSVEFSQGCIKDIRSLSTFKDSD